MTKYEIVEYENDTPEYIYEKTGNIDKIIKDYVGKNKYWEIYKDQYPDKITIFRESIFYNNETGQEVNEEYLKQNPDIDYMNDGQHYENTYITIIEKVDKKW